MPITSTVLTRVYILLLSTAVVAAVSYYFVIALPGYNQAKIDLEKEKFRAEQAEKIEKKEMLDSCVEEAESDYWEYVKLNGQKTETKGVYNAELDVWDRAARAKKADLDECHRRYGE